ncbi:MAG: NAD(P)/FAD-dependent oxidoreductase, partial [Candidatus Limnocylindria bacterium]
MQRIVIVGGGVGGTLAANLLARGLSAPIDRGDVTLTLIDDRGEHVYQPGFMYIAMGNEAPEHLVRPERSLLDRRVRLEIGRATRVDTKRQLVTLANGERLAYDQLILATGSRTAPEEIEHFEAEAHHFYGADAAQRLRAALDAFEGGRIVIGIAGMPYKCPPAPLEVAFLIEAELRHRRLRDRSEVHFCSPIGRAFTIESVSEMATPIMAAKRIELHTFFNVEAIDPERKVVSSLEGEELPYDLLVLVPPHHGAQMLIDSGLAPAPGGWLPTDPHTLLLTGRTNVYAIGYATDLPLSKAGSTA